MRTSTRNAILAVLAGFCLLYGGTVIAQEDTYKAGMNYFKSGKYVEAAAEFQALVDGAPAYDYGYFMLGYSYVKLGKTDQAVTNFKAAIDLNGEKYTYHNGLAGAYMKSRQYRMVVETLNGAESILPEKHKASFYSTRGKSYYALKKWDEAITDLNKAKSLKTTAAIMTNLGVAYSNTGQDSKAVAAFDASLKLDSKNSKNYKRLADSLMNVGARKTNKSSKLSTYKEALAAANKYLAAKPGDVDAINLVGVAALGAHDFKTAESSFKKVLEKEPKNCLAMMNLATSQIAVKGWKAAESTLNKAIACDSKNPLAQSNMGFVLMKQKRLDESLKSYQVAYKMKPSASVKAAMEKVQGNIDVIDNNKKMDQIAAANEQAKKDAKAA